MSLSPTIDRRHLLLGAGSLLAAGTPDVLNLIPEYNSAGRFLDIAADLADRGHSPRRIEKILGGNFARLFREVWPREGDD